MSNSVNKELLNMLRDLTGDDAEFMAELISAYIQNLQEFKTEASTAVREMDLVKLKAYLHKINPTLITIKYDKEYEELLSMKDQLDEYSIEGNLQKVELIIHRAVQQLEKLHEEI